MTNYFDNQNQQFCTDGNSFEAVPFENLFRTVSCGAVKRVLAQTNLTPMLFVKITKLKTGIPLDIAGVRTLFEDTMPEEQALRLIEKVIGLKEGTLDLPEDELTDALAGLRTYMYELLDEKRDKRFIFLYQPCPRLQVYCLNHGLKCDFDAETARFLPDLEGISLNERQERLRESLSGSALLLLEPGADSDSERKSGPFDELQLMEALEPYASMLGRLSTQAMDMASIRGGQLMDIVLSAVADAFGFDAELLQFYDTGDSVFREKLAADIKKHMAAYLSPEVRGESGSRNEPEVIYEEPGTDLMDDIDLETEIYSSCWEELLCDDGMSSEEFSEWYEERATEEQLLRWASEIATEQYFFNSICAPEIRSVNELVVPLTRSNEMLIEHAYTEYLKEHSITAEDEQ